MKKTAIILAILLTTLGNLSAQYQVAYKQAKAQEKKGLYYKAILSYNAAAISRDKPSANDVNKRIDYCASKLNGLRLEAEKQKKLANQQRVTAETATEESKKQQKLAIEAKQYAEQLQLKAEEALTKAKEMQMLVETAMFDKAVKERNKAWKGYANMTYEGTKQLKYEGQKVLESIDSLNLSNNALFRIPQEVSHCPNLKHLNLLGNKDMDWAESLSVLSELSPEVGIYVSIKDLDDFFYLYWERITGIELLKKDLSKIPENILNQKQLKYLSISGGYNSNVYLDSLPSKLFELSELKHLSVTSCQIEHLPLDIEKLKNLSFLDLSRNKIKKIPAEIGTLTNLSTLILKRNALKNVPPEIKGLTNLSKLNLDENALEIFPPEIGYLKNLTELSAYSNQLIAIPPEIGQLHKLVKLELTSNKLKTFPPEIGNLSKLLELWVSWNEITSIPKEIGELSNLLHFSLSWNKLKTIPKEVGQLTKLIEFFINVNEDLDLNSLANAFKKYQRPIKIGDRESGYNDDEKMLYINVSFKEKFPLEFAQIENLSELKFVEQKMPSLPSGISKFKNLSTLNLSYVGLINLPSEIGKLSKLQILNLSENDNLDFAKLCDAFKNFPKEIIITSSRIPKNRNNTKLLIKVSSLKNLPPEIGKLANLTNLEFPNSTLANVSPEIGELKKLSVLNFGSYTFKSLPSEFLSLQTLDSELWLKIGKHLYNYGNYKQAISCFEKLASKEKDESTLSTLAYAYAYAEEYSKSLETFDKIISRDTLKIKIGKATTYHKMGEHAKAYNLLTEVCESGTNNYSYFYKLSQYALFNSKPKEAILAAEKSLELESSFLFVYSYLAMAHVLNNRFDLAESIYLEWGEYFLEDDGIFYKTYFLEDLEELEAAGIKHKDFAKVKELLK